MSTISYGSITIVDITDVGEFSVYPKCNLPTTVIYSSDPVGYTPNWQSNNLAITPVAYYAGQSVSSNLTWVWTRKEGTSSTGSAISASRGEYVSNGTDPIGGQTYAPGTLVVTQNQFASGTNYSQLTYVVTATYSDATIGRDLVAEGQITFSKVEQGASAKTAKITGENVFKYNTNGALTPTGATITLTGEVVNCTISGWQYKNGSGNYVAYPNSGTASTLTVNPTDAVFFNDKANIKLVTNDNKIYDVFTIYKLYDGAAGTATISAVLSNEDQMIAARANGTPVSYNGATSTVRVLMGGNDITKDATITITSDSGVGYTPSKSDDSYTSNDTVTVTSLNNSTTAANIYFKCEGYAERKDLNNNTYVANKYYIKSGSDYIIATGAYNGNLTYYEHYDLTKTFSLIKVTAGADAQTFYIYDLVLNTLSINKDIQGNYVPANYIASATRTTVSPTSVTTAAYTGKYRITESYSNSDDVVVYAASNAAVASLTRTPTSNTVTKILVELLDTGGSEVLDKQTIIITSDGKTGQQGPQGNAGKDAISVLLGNEAEVIPCNSKNKVGSQHVVEIPFATYKGTARVASTSVSADALLSGVTATTGNSSTSSDGYVRYTIPANTTVPVSGTAQIQITVEGTIYTKLFSYTRSSDAADAVVMQLYSPDGGLIENGTGSVTIKGTLRDGTEDVVSQATWSWKKYGGAHADAEGYGDIDGNNPEGEDPEASASGATLTVYPSAVNGYASFKATAVYDSETYVAYMSIQDKSDPIQVSVHSTVGTQIVNGQGAGAIYVRVTRDGEEIDAIGDARVSAGTASHTTVSNPSAGESYFELNATNRTATWWRYTNGAWEQPTLEATYEWSFRDKNNAQITTSTASLPLDINGKMYGKAIYVDANTVANKITADVKVTV